MSLSEWQPIATAPRDGTTLLVWKADSHGGFVSLAKWITAWNGEQLWDADWGEGAQFPVTYWQPLPEPPSPDHPSEIPVE